MSSPAEPFPETRWSVLLAGGAGREAALEALARAYWRPVYGYALTRRGLSHEDALDATQEFFLWLVTGDLLGKADPARGRFRALIKVALDRFLVDIHRAANAERRGGGRTLLSLDAPGDGGSDAGSDGDGGAPLDLAAVAGRSPEDVLDDLWRQELLSRALTRLERRLTAEGRTTHFALFKAHYIESADDPADPARSYDTLAARHGVSRVDVSNWLMRTKGWFRDEVRKAVLETVGDAQNLDLELRWLFGDPPPS